MLALRQRVATNRSVRRAFTPLMPNVCHWKQSLGLPRCRHIVRMLEAVLVVALGWLRCLPTMVVVLQALVPVEVQLARCSRRHRRQLARLIEKVSNSSPLTIQQLVVGLSSCLHPRHHLQAQCKLYQHL